MTTHFITFGSANYENSLRRIQREATATKWFATIRIYREVDLSTRNKEWIYRPENRRGFGYWIWKLEFITRRLSEIADNDYLVYCDAGCYINGSASKRFTEYRNMISPASGKDMISFALTHNEYLWTKRETAKVCGATDEAMKTPQLVGGIKIIRNTPEIRKFLGDLFDLVSNNHDIINDKRGDEHPEFRDHRHDQSVMSVSIKSHYMDRSVILADETYPPPGQGWASLSAMPFLARRLRA